MPPVVIVLGAESGIGAACVSAFGATDDRVAIMHHASAAGAEATAEAVRRAGGEAMTVQARVDDEASVNTAFQTVGGAWRPADVLINSAGLNMSGDTVREMTLAQWRRLLDADLTGAFLTSRRFLEGRGDRDGDASIIDVSSIMPMRCGPAERTTAQRRGSVEARRDFERRDRSGSTPSSRA